MTSAEDLKIFLLRYSQSVNLGHKIADANKCKTHAHRFQRFYEAKNSSSQNRCNVVTFSEKILNVDLKFLGAVFA
jgi:hypothetical protein